MEGCGTDIVEGWRGTDIVEGCHGCGTDVVEGCGTVSMLGVVSVKVGAVSVLGAVSVQTMAWFTVQHGSHGFALGRARVLHCRRSSRRKSEVTGVALTFRTGVALTLWEGVALTLWKGVALTLWKGVTDIVKGCGTDVVERSRDWHCGRAWHG